MMRVPRLYVLLTASLLFSCAGDPKQAAVPVPDIGAMSADASSPVQPAKPTLRRAGADPLAYRLRGLDQLRSVCSHAGDDSIRSLFCGDVPPKISSMLELLTALKIDGSMLGGLNALSMVAHSTSLGARSISSINPRMVAVRIEPPLFDDANNPVGPTVQDGVPELITIAFSRGEQFSELMVRDRIDRELRFYLLAFRQACNDADGGCAPGDLLTPETEQNWLETSLYDERDLANTVLDCAPCHQPDGPGTSKLLRMQELHTPWTHWLGASTEGGQALLDDYIAAKGDEPFAGYTGQQVQSANPVNLNLQAVYAGPNAQPNPFDSAAIEAEVRRSAAALGGAQPKDNTIPGRSDTWRVGYESARRGESMTFPYHDVKVSDPAKLARMTDAYRAYRRGELDRSLLPDIRDVLPDDPQRLAEMGLMTEPGLSGEDVLLQACSICHNDRLDQTLSRARFRANLVGVDRAERDNAIARLRLTEDDPLAMPPPRLRTLTPEARSRAIEALMR
jgi:mono/diheme cytochrome c family protein